MEKTAQKPVKLLFCFFHIIYYLRNAAVKIESIDVAETIKTTKALIETEASLSLDLKEALDQLL
jgi:hypothetical protein